MSWYLIAPADESADPFPGVQVAHESWAGAVEHLRAVAASRARVSERDYRVTEVSEAEAEQARAEHRARRHAARAASADGR